MFVGKWYEKRAKIGALWCLRGGEIVIKSAPFKMTLLRLPYRNMDSQQYHTTQYIHCPCAYSETPYRIFEKTLACRIDSGMLSQRIKLNPFYWTGCFVDSDFDWRECKTKSVAHSS